MTAVRVAPLDAPQINAGNAVWTDDAELRAKFAEAVIAGGHTCGRSMSPHGPTQVGASGIHYVPTCKHHCVIGLMLRRDGAAWAMVVPIAVPLAQHLLKGMVRCLPMTNRHLHPKGFVFALSALVLVAGTMTVAADTTARGGRLRECGGDGCRRSNIIINMHAGRGCSNLQRLIGKDISNWWWPCCRCSTVGIAVADVLVTFVPGRLDVVLGLGALVLAIVALAQTGAVRLPARSRHWAHRSRSWAWRSSGAIRRRSSRSTWWAWPASR